MREARRDYLRDFAVAILHQAGKPLTAGEVVEHMVVLATAEGHPEKFWRGCDASAMFGHLRALEADGIVERNGTKPDGRAGRPSPAWQPTAPRIPNASIPFPPEEDEAAAETPQAEPPVDPYAGLNKTQLFTLLAVHDELAALTARHMRELRDWNECARRTLAAVGLGASA